MIDEKVNKSIALLRATCRDKEVELCYSGGKDSDVILELARMAGINYRAIYRCTTIDPPGTIKHCKENGVKIVRPKENFFQIVRRKGIPTRRARFCCEILKEYKIMDVAIQGIRRCESKARARRYKEPTICRIYGSKANHVEVIFPILDWTNSDELEFIKERCIKLHPLYYCKNGQIDITRRLGCIGCPMQSDHGLADFKAHPKIVKQWIVNCQIWFDNLPKNAKSREKFRDACELFTHNVFFNSYELFRQAINGGLFGSGNDVNCKAFLENYFKIEL